MPDTILSTRIVDISPVRPAPMGGFASAERCSEGIDGLLEANLALLRRGDEALLIVSVDTLFIGAPLTARIEAAAAESLAGAKVSVLSLASHTHFAPMLDPAKPPIGGCDEEEIGRVGDLIAAAIAALGEGRPIASVRAGKGRSDSAINRRRRWRWPTAVRIAGKFDDAIYMADNPLGPRDPAMRIWIWRDQDGAPLAALWSYACHPVFFPTPNIASADYVGRAREALRRRLGADLPVLFLPGCMGDVWPALGSERLGPGMLWRRLLYGPGSKPVDREQWEEWARGLVEDLLGAEAAATEEPVANAPFVARRAELPVAELIDGSSVTPALIGKRATLPGIGRVATLSCEPVTEIAALVAPDALLLGYEGDVFGYLPTDAMVREGGYEPKRSLPLFGIHGRFRPGLDARLIAFGRALSAGESAATPPAAETA